MARLAHSDRARTDGPPDPGAPRARAAALPPEERRAAIIDATLPLLLEHGSGVTTRQIAEGAGIAEGTIFRVFADKDELVAAVVERVFDPEAVTGALLGVDRTLPFEERLTAAVSVLQQRVAVIWQVMTAVGMVRLPDGHEPTGKRREAPEMLALAALIEPERERLRRDPIETARLLRSMTFACSHPAFVGEEPMSADEIVSLLLDGLRTP